MKKIIPKYKKRIALIAMLTGMIAGAIMPLQGVYSQTVVPVFFHIFRDDNGTDAGATEAQIQSEFNQLKADYAACNICFMYMGFDYISNTDFNQGNFNYILVSYNLAIRSYCISNYLNIFYHASLGSNNYEEFGDVYRSVFYYDFNNSTGSCGLMNWNINGNWSNLCSISRSYIGVAQTISYIVGKCFGLGDTWQNFCGNSPGYETINGNNSSTAGDHITDTPADPWYFHAVLNSGCWSTSSCCYTGSCQDDNGQTNWNPPYTNLMAEWWHLGWGPLSLTPGQFTRANNFAALFSPPLDSQVTSVTYSSGSNWFSASNTITTNGVVHFYANNISTLVSSLVTLSPGFRSNPSVGGLTLIKGYSCTPGVPRVASEIKSEIISAKEISLKCFPNPFSGNLTVEFDLTKDDNASIKLYNMVGKEMKTISKSLYAKGSHQVNINASDVPAGIYIVVLQTSGFKKEQKLVKVN